MDIANFLQDFIATMLRMATPIALGALACTISERSGIVNIGIEGIMMLGGFVGAAASYYTGSPWIGLIAGALAGTLCGSILGLLTIYFNGDQIVIGIGLNLLGAGASTLGIVMVWGNRGASGWLTGLPTVNIPGLSGVPFLGQILSGYDPTVYLCWFLVLLAYAFLFRTPFGLRIRASGEHPTAVETVGLNVFQLRLVAVLISGTLAGLGGISLSLGALNVFTHGLTAGRGFLAFAANMFGQWNPFGSFAASLLFGGMEALRMRLQGVGIPPQFLQMSPYLVTLIVLTIAGKKTRSPAALAIPFLHPIGGSSRKALKRQDHLLLR